jgi:hypothetical protein
MKKLHESLDIDIPISGVSHHMMFRTSFIRELFSLVEDGWLAEGLHTGIFWELFIDCVDDTIKPLEIGSGASEYEIYFGFMIKYKSEKMCLRKLNWIGHKRVTDVSQFEGYDYVSLHHYLV